jgi:hypothetical protein
MLGGGGGRGVAVALVLLHCSDITPTLNSSLYLSYARLLHGCDLISPPGMCHDALKSESAVPGVPSCWTCQYNNCLQESHAIKKTNKFIGDHFKIQPPFFHKTNLRHPYASSSYSVPNFMLVSSMAWSFQIMHPTTCRPVDITCDHKANLFRGGSAWNWWVPTILWPGAVWIDLQFTQSKAKLPQGRGIFLCGGPKIHDTLAKSRGQSSNWPIGWSTQQILGGPRPPSEPPMEVLVRWVEPIRLGWSYPTLTLNLLAQVKFLLTVSRQPTFCFAGGAKVFGPDQSPTSRHTPIHQPVCASFRRAPGLQPQTMYI